MAVLVATFWEDTLLDVALERDVRGEAPSGVRRIATVVVAEPLVPYGRRIDWRAPRLFALSALVHVLFVIGAWIAPEPERRRIEREWPASTWVEEERPLRAARPPPPAPEADATREYGDPAGSVLDGLRENHRPASAEATMRDLRDVLKSPMFTRGGLGTRIETDFVPAAPDDGLAGLETRGHTPSAPYVAIGSLRRIEPVGPPSLVKGRELWAYDRWIGCCCLGHERDPGIRRRLVEARFRFKHCYERELPWEPDLSGKIVTMFEVGMDGRVTKVETRESTMNFRPVEECIARVIRTIRFPKQDHVVEAHYPLIFESGN